MESCAASYGTAPPETGSPEAQEWLETGVATVFAGLYTYAPRAYF